MYMYANNVFGYIMLNIILFTLQLSIRDSDKRMRMKKENLESKALKIKEKAAKISENKGNNLFISDNNKNYLHIIIFLMIY